jgi:drug/metabolite transporter (DMT)-like permease
LKILQEAITLTVFVIFSLTYLHERFRWQYAVGVALVFAGVFVIFSTDTKPAHAQEAVAAPGAPAGEKSGDGAAIVTSSTREGSP